MRGHVAGAMTDAPAVSERPQPELVTAEGPWGGPVYRYRGAEIRCAESGHVRALFTAGHPLHGRSSRVGGHDVAAVTLR